MLRVVYVSHCSALSGAELALANLIPALDVQPIVVLAEDGPLVGHLRSRGIECRVLPMASETREVRKDSLVSSLDGLRHVLGTVGYALRLARLLRDLKPDLVHTNSLKAHLYGGLAARLAGVPQVWHARDRISEDYLPSPAVKLVRLCARWLPTAVIANSEATKATLPSRHLTRIYTAVPLPVPQPQADVRPFTIGMVGRLSPWKGQDVFVRAFQQAFPAGSPSSSVPARAHLIGSALFGEEDYEAELLTQVDGDDRIELRGFRSDLGAELAQLDVLVHASRIPEPFGQVVVEGLAAGVPVIASDAGGPAELIDHEVTGLLTPPGDVDALADAMRLLAQDPGLRTRLVDAGRRASLAYTPARIAPQVMAVYASVLRASSVSSVFWLRAYTTPVTDAAVGICPQDVA